MVRVAGHRAHQIQQLPARIGCVGRHGRQVVAQPEGGHGDREDVALTVEHDRGADRSEELKEGPARGGQQLASEPPQEQVSPLVDAQVEPAEDALVLELAQPAAEDPDQDEQHGQAVPPDASG